MMHRLTFAALALAPMFVHAQENAAVQAAEAACGPSTENPQAQFVASDGQVANPPAGKALVYVVDFDPDANAIGLEVGVDGRWAGALRGRTQFSLVLDPGEHHFCARMQGGKHSARHIGMRIYGGETGFLHANLVRDDVTYIAVGVQKANISGSDAPDFLFYARIWRTNPDEGRFLLAVSKKSITSKTNEHPCQ